MTRPVWLQSEVSVPELLERCGLAASKRKRAWRFSLPGAQGVGVTARRDDGFLTLKLPVRRQRAAEKVDLGRWLELNARLPGGAKFALDAASGRVLILAEIPFDPWAHDADADAVCRRISEACAGLRTALELRDTMRADGESDQPLQTTQQPATGTSVSSPGGDGALELDFTTELRPGDGAGEHDLGPCADQLHERCLQAGWPASRSRGGPLGVTLDVPNSSCVGRFEAVGGDAVRVRSEPCWRAADQPICRQAIDYLLLRASGVVRLAAAARLPAAPGLAAGPYAWQVRWESLPEAVELNDALTALSLACRLTEHEVEALRDAALARQYLALQGRTKTRS